MKRFSRGWAILWVFVFFSQCRKKVPDEGVFLPSETLPVRIALPNWGSPTRVHLAFSTTADSGTAILIKRLVAASLCRDREIAIEDSEPFLFLEADVYQLAFRVDPQGERVKVEARLTDPSGQTLATQYYEDSASQLFVLSEEMASRTLSALFPGKSAEKRGFTTLGQDVIASLARGFYLLEMKNRAATQEAAVLFQKVLREDSTSVTALIGLAEAYLRLIEAGWERHRVFVQLAQNAIHKAIQSDPSNPQAYVLLGRCFLAWGDNRQAEKAFRQALALNPNQVGAWVALGRLYGHLGLYEPALVCDNRALALRPGDPDVLFHRAVVWMGLRRHEKAEKALQEVVHIRPDHHEAWFFLALARLYRGRYPAAREALENAEADSPMVQAAWALLEARSGYTDEALGRIELKVVPSVRHDPALALAAASGYAVLGRNGQAVSWFEKALDFGYRDYPWVLHDPNFDGLRQDERFVRLMERLKGCWEKEVRLHFGETG